jgi:hypothetical protein
MTAVVAVGMLGFQLIRARDVRWLLAVGVSTTSKAGAAPTGSARAEVPRLLAMVERVSAKQLLTVRRVPELSGPVPARPILTLPVLTLAAVAEIIDAAAVAAPRFPTVALTRAAVALCALSVRALSSVEPLTGFTRAAAILTIPGTVRTLTVATLAVAALSIATLPILRTL